ncbi:MAG: hypothetical protein JO264_19145 [Acidisphaera sp.]|nr:hypothetical protein [Acidisphaera sp.]
MDQPADAEQTVRFFQLVAPARAPQRADRSAAGTIPHRAAQYCDAITVAAAFGWYVFPPMDFRVLWDGRDLFWTYHGVDDWLALGAAQFPDFAASFDAHAPDELKGYAPPFLTALPEPGLLQIWSGVMARTRPGWSLLVRPPANLPRSGGFDMYEGIIESDRWFGPLFINLRLTRTHVPVDINGEWPLFQVQPIPQHAYAEATLGASAIVSGLESFSPRDWQDYDRTVVRPEGKSAHQIGHYAAATRRRRKQAS